MSATQISEKQLKINEVLAKVYPVGSLYFNASVSTNPATLLGFGTWVVFGAGRVPVGINSADADFDSLGEEIGVKSVTLTSAQSGLPAHSHNIKVIPRDTAWVAPSQGVNYSYTNASTYAFATEGQELNASQAHTNIQPSIVVAIWKRTE